MPGAYSPPLNGTARNNNARIFRLGNPDTAPMRNGGQLSDYISPESPATPWVGTFVGWQNPRTNAYTLVAGITDDGFLMLDLRHRTQAGAGSLSRRKRYELINQFLEGINAPYRISSTGKQIRFCPGGTISTVGRYNYNWMRWTMQGGSGQPETQREHDAGSCSPDWFNGAVRLASEYRISQTVQIQGSLRHDIQLPFSPESNPIHHEVYRLIRATCNHRNSRDVVFSDLAIPAGNVATGIIIHCNQRDEEFYATNTMV